MSNESQISASISASTKKLLDRFTVNRGLRKNFVVEQALLYFMAARSELPDEAFIPARIVLEDAAFDELVKVIENPGSPTEAMRELMRADRD